MIDNQELILAELTRELVEQFAPERIVLFGSRARGDHHPDSDYDLLMVLGESPFSEDAVRDTAREISTNVEIFVDTRDRFERRRADVGTFEYVADLEGRILYTRSTAPEARSVREPSNEPPESLQEWIERARSDFTAMEAMLKLAPDVRDGTVFHAHQGVEKMLKAVLVSRHVRPPRTHELPELLIGLPRELRDDLRLVEACRGLDTLWPSSRYPSKPMPTAEQVEQAVAWARRAREIVNAIVAI